MITNLAFDFEEEFILEDECVLLRSLTYKDCNNLLHFSLSEPETWQYSLISAASEENLKIYIDAALQARKNKTAYPFVVFDKRINAYAGSTRFYDVQLNNKSTQLGYTWYGKEFRGTGLNKHCKYLMLQFAFEQVGFERVEFRADNNNKRSIAAMKRIGCIEEGVLRQNVATDTGYKRDSIILSILQNEWHATVKQLLQTQMK